MNDTDILSASSEQPPQARCYDYSSTAWFYEWLSHFYTAGTIRRAKGAQAAFWRGADLFYWALGVMDLHRMHDYAAFFPALGLDVMRAVDFRVLGCAPFYIRNLVGVKRQELAKACHGIVPSGA